jgi:hypothetical protein
MISAETLRWDKDMTKSEAKLVAGSAVNCSVAGNMF